GLSRPCQSHAAARPRAEHLAELDRSAAEDIHEYGHRNADPLFDDAADVHHGARPVRLKHAQPIRERALPLGIHARQRALRRLHRRPRHIDPQRGGAAEPRPRGEDQQASAFVTRLQWRLTKESEMRGTYVVWPAIVLMSA